MCTNFTTDVIWSNKNMCIITSEASQSKSKRVFPFKDTSALLNIRATALRCFSSGTSHFCVPPYNICG